MREIELTKGQIALVDDEDYDELFQYKWHASAVTVQNSQNNVVRAKSGYKGVCLRAHGKYQATIRVDQKTRHLGYFYDKLAAARAYDLEAIHCFGPQARLNFPIINE